MKILVMQLCLVLNTVYRFRWSCGTWPGTSYVWRSIALFADVRSSGDISGKILHLIRFSWRNITWGQDQRARPNSTQLSPAVQLSDNRVLWSLNWTVKWSWIGRCDHSKNSTPLHSTKNCQLFCHWRFFVELSRVFRDYTSIYYNNGSQEARLVKYTVT